MKIDASPEWSDVESWVWNQLRLGRVANIDEFILGEASISDPTSFGNNRLISVQFLEDVLFKKPYTAEISWQGIRIEAARIDDTIKLSYAVIDKNLMFDRCYFSAPVLLGGITAQNISFDGCLIQKNLSLPGAKIERDFSISNSIVNGDIVCPSSSFDRIFARGGKYKNVVMWQIKVRLFLSFRDSSISDRLEIYAAEIGTNVGLNFDCPDVFIARSYIGDSLNLNRARLKNVDLSGTEINGELRLHYNSEEPVWDEDAILNLRNVRCDAVQDAPEVWPNSIELDGFDYKRWGGLGADPTGVTSRGSRWFVNWLSKDTPYTPQPYRQCSAVLSSMGHPELANDVLYNARERERRVAWLGKDFLRWTGLSLLKSLIGYGYGRRLLFYPLSWIVAITLLGTLAIYLSDCFHNTTIVTELGGFWDVQFFSLDTLLPIVTLNEATSSQAWDEPVKYYLYFHRIMGWIISGFLAAGASGLTKLN